MIDSSIKVENCNLYQPTSYYWFFFKCNFSYDFDAKYLKLVIRYLPVQVVSIDGDEI